jgi:hypothetical protein
MDKKQYSQLIKRCVKKKIVTNTTSTIPPINIVITKDIKKPKVEKQNKQEDYIDEKEMKNIFQELMNAG